MENASFLSMGCYRVRERTLRWSCHGQLRGFYRKVRLGKGQTSEVIKYVILLFTEAEQNKYKMIAIAASTFLLLCNILQWVECARLH